METADALRILLSSVPYKLPILLVVIGGIIVAVVNYSKNPSVSRRVTGGLAMLLAAEFLSLFTSLLNYYIYRNHDVQSGFVYIGYVVAFFIAVVSAAGIGLILWAVWTERKSV